MHKRSESARRNITAARKALVARSLDKRALETVSGGNATETPIEARIPIVPTPIPGD